MKFVSVSQLAEILMAKKFVKGAAIFANIVQQTEPKMRKTGNPYIGAVKVSRYNIILNSEYETAVVNQLKREEKDPTDYKKGKNTMPLTFGENNRFIGYFDGKPVLQLRPNDNSKPETTYFYKGEQISKSLLEPFLQESSHATNQGTEREIFWRKVYLSNVLELRMDGDEYKVIKG